jgi:hypothetical protein
MADGAAQTKSVYLPSVHLCKAADLSRLLLECGIGLVGGAGVSKVINGRDIVMCGCFIARQSVAATQVTIIPCNQHHHKENLTGN